MNIRISPVQKLITRLQTSSMLQMLGPCRRWWTREFFQKLPMIISALISQLWHTYSGWHPACGAPHHQTALYSSSPTAGGAVALSGGHRRFIRCRRTPGGWGHGTNDCLGKDSWLDPCRKRFPSRAFLSLKKLFGKWCWHLFSAVKILSSLLKKWSLKPFFVSAAFRCNN